MTDSTIKSTIHIRCMIRRDMPAVLAIEESSFEFHWTEEEFIRYLRQRDHICILAELESEPIGFMIYELHKSRLGLLKFVVDARHRRMGVGSDLMARLGGNLTVNPRHRNRITLEVRETNLVAQKFLKSMGFKATGVLRNRYEEAAEDAYQMEYRVDDWCGD